MYIKNSRQDRSHIFAQRKLLQFHLGIPLTTPNKFQVESVLCKGFLSRSRFLARLLLPPPIQVPSISMAFLPAANDESASAVNDDDELTNILRPVIAIDIVQIRTDSHVNPVDVSYPFSLMCPQHIESVGQINKRRMIPNWLGQNGHRLVIFHDGVSKGKINKTGKTTS